MTKAQKIIYWATTGFLAASLLASGGQQLFHVENPGAIAPPYAWGIVKLGYPEYILTLLGTWKILGALAILAPKFPLLKEWAYAGIFFLLTGALYSHISSGHAWVELVPAGLLLILVVPSWYLRPASRKLLRPKTAKA